MPWSRMMLSAGRTVMFSATTVALSMVVLVLFPMHFLKSFAYAGVATVAFAAAAAVVVTPAALVLIGDRLDSLDVAGSFGACWHRPEPTPVPVEQRFWYRTAKRVMRNALPLGMAGRRVAAAARRAVPRRAVGLPRRPRAATDGVRPPGRRSVAQGLRQQFRYRGHARHSRHRRPQPERHRRLRRQFVSRARRFGRIRPDGHLCLGQARRTAVGADRRELGYRLPHRGQHGSAVLRPLGEPTRPAARRRDPCGQAGRHDRHRADEPRQRRRDHIDVCRSSSG